MTEFKFLVGYVALLVFYSFSIGLISPALSEEYNIDVPVYPDVTSEGFGTDIIGEAIAFATFVIDQLVFFITIFTTVPTVSELTFLIFSPMLIGLVYIFITKLLIPFIQSLPFT